VSVTSEPELIGLVIFTPEGPARIRVRAPRMRITDWLNSSEPIEVLEGDSNTELPSSGWKALSRNECLIVLPPAEPTDPTRRLHRRKQRVSMRLGPLTVSGAAHIPAGTEATAFLKRHGLSFVALTDVTIDPPDHGIDSAPVAIVHLAVAERLQPSTGIDRIEIRDANG
jgi:hypothetical protein